MSRLLLPRNPAARLLAAAVAFFVVLNVVAFVIAALRPEPSGEDGSAYATQPLGAAAYAELLRREGHPVRYLRSALAAAPLDPAATIVLLDAPGLHAAERRALARFVRAGGRLIAAGKDAGRGVVPRAPSWTPDGPRTAGRVATVSETRFVRRIASAGDGGFDSAGGALPALGEHPALLAVARAGRGRALLLADSAPLQNRLLARADNAALGLALAGPSRRAVTFVESVHGFGASTGLAALPARWRLALAVAVLAGLLWLLSQARRLGPAEDDGGERTPARREHVEALAIALSRTRDAPAALAPVQAAARRQVIQRAALAHDAPDEAVREAALRLGFDEEEAATVSGAPGADDALAIGRAQARGRR
jgi:hypothetical protein